MGKVRTKHFGIDIFNQSLNAPPTYYRSRPIMTYLVMKYAKNDALYPKDPEKRGLVESRLFFDLCTLYESIFVYGVSNSRSSIGVFMKINI